MGCLPPPCPLFKPLAHTKPGELNKADSGSRFWVIWGAFLFPEGGTASQRCMRPKTHFGPRKKMIQLFHNFGGRRPTEKEIRLNNNNTNFRFPIFHRLRHFT